MRQGPSFGRTTHKDTRQCETGLISTSKLIGKEAGNRYSAGIEKGAGTIAHGVVLASLRPSQHPRRAVWGRGVRVCVRGCVCVVGGWVCFMRQ